MSVATAVVNSGVQQLCHMQNPSFHTSAPLFVMFSELSGLGVR